MRISVVSSHHSFHYRQNTRTRNSPSAEAQVAIIRLDYYAIHVEATVNAVTGNIMAVCTHGGPKLSARKAPWASPTMIGQLHPS
jgi:hypothetical protein